MPRQIKKLEVEAYLEEELKLNVIALDEQPNRGKTIKEKYEHYSKDTGYAVLMMSPDDTLEVDGQVYKQARQNVVLELFYFISNLGRSNVRAVCRDAIRYIRRTSFADQRDLEIRTA